MSTIEYNVYEILKSKFGEMQAKQVLEYFDSKSVENFDCKKDILLTKEDKLELVSKIENSKSDMIKWMFIFWITQMVSLFAFMLYFIKK